MTKEQEANYFAACLLMPADDVERFLDLEDISDRLVERHDEEDDLDDLIGGLEDGEPLWTQM